jgi:DNA-binding LytR/AlgR family response regulator
MMERKTKCLIVDDEPHAIEVLKTYIAATPALQIAGECSNAVAAFDFLQKNTVDLIFLDIQMPRLNGIEFMKSLTQSPKIVFTTAYREYALEGFDLGAVDYLLKPISFDRFLKAVYRLTLTNARHEPERQEHSSERFLYFRADRKMVKVYLNDILYIESLKDYVKIITSKGQIITKQSISSVEEMLPEGEFMRIHRSFVVAVRKIDSYTSNDITIGKTELPVGPLYRHEITKKIQISS